MHICFPMKIKQKRNEGSDTEADLMASNNFFAHLIKELSVTRYRNNKQLMLIFIP